MAASPAHASHGWAGAAATVAVVQFLVSDGAAAMTGQVLEVGAGLVYR